MAVGPGVKLPLLLARVKSPRASSHMLQVQGHALLAVIGHLPVIPAPLPSAAERSIAPMEHAAVAVKEVVTFLELCHIELW